MWDKGPGAGIKPTGEATSPLRRVRDMLLPALRYLFSPEVHVYAFSIAANAFLSFFPFCLLLLTVCRRWLHWQAASDVILELLRSRLPLGTEFLIRNLTILVQGRPRLQLMSVVMLLFTTSGVFLPLEIALNRVWGFDRNRSLMRNQLRSFLLAMATGILAFFWILLTSVAQWLLSLVSGAIPSQVVRHALSRGLLEVLSIPFAVSIFFVIYYYLPNGEVPLDRVLLAAVFAALLITLARFIYELTLPLFRFREVYGPFALSVTLLFWAFVGALILLFGAHLSARDFRNHSGPES